MEYTTILLGLLLALTLMYGLQSLARRRRVKKRLPPGPFPLPIIGNLHSLGNQPHKSLTNLAKIHGPIMNVQFGQINTVVISSAILAKQVMQKQDLNFCNRSIPDALRACDHSDFSVVWLPVNGSRWRTLRKIMNSNLFSSTKLDANNHLRSRKVQEMIECCNQSAQIGEAVDVGKEAFRTTLNLLSNTIFSMDLGDSTSDSAKDFKNLVCNIMVEAAKNNLVDFFPFLEKIDPQGINHRMNNHMTKMFDLFRRLINERTEERGLRNDIKGDVLDALLSISKDSP